MKSKDCCALRLCACFVVAMAGIANADTLYWGLTAAPNPNVIQCSDRDGGNQATVFTLNTPEPRDIFLDRAAGKLYFSSANNPGTDNRLRRANLDGSAVEDLVLLGSGIPSGLTGSPASGKMYWVQTLNVFRANLDGTSVEMIANVPGMDGLAVSSAGDEVYWIVNDAGNTIIRRADPNGANVSDVLVAAGETSFIGGLSVGGGRLYWTNFSNELRHATVTGTDLGVVLTTTDPVLSIFVDEGQEELYWVTIGTPPMIWRSGLDGVSPQQLVIAATGTAFNDVAMLESGPPVPTVATWGLVIMAMLLLAAGTVVSNRRSLHRLYGG